MASRAHPVNQASSIENGTYVKAIGRELSIISTNQLAPHTNNTHKTDKQRPKKSAAQRTISIAQNPTEPEDFATKTQNKPNATTATTTPPNRHQEKNNEKSG